jgi:hypothetical protein
MIFCPNIQGQEPWTEPSEMKSKINNLSPYLISVRYLVSMVVKLTQTN